MTRTAGVKSCEGKANITLDVSTVIYYMFDENLMSLVVAQTAFCPYTCFCLETVVKFACVFFGVRSTACLLHHIYSKCNGWMLYTLYSSTNIIRVIKSRRLGWAGHVARMGRLVAHTGF